MKSLFSILVLLPLLFNIGITQDTLDLSEIKITASKLPMERYKTGRGVIILNQQNLKDKSIHSLDELFRSLPGFNINSRNGFGVQADIGMRGSTFSQVLILIDNVRFNDPLTAHFNNNFPVPISSIDKIEIIMGPAAASYGADAVGGLIHIKTKTYTGHHNAKQYSFTGNTSGGKYNYLQSDVNLEYQHSNWNLSLGVKNNISDGETHVNPNFISGVSSDSLFNNFFDLRSYTAAVGYRFTDHLTAYARLGFDDRHFAAKYFYTRSAFDESTEFTSNLWSLGGIQYQKDNHQVEFNLGHRKVNDEFIFNPLFPANYHETRQTQLNLTHGITLNKKLSVSYGAQFLRKDIESTDRGTHQNINLGLFGITAFRFSDQFFANASLRLEYDENFGIEPIPQASISYKKNNYLLRASYGRSVRAADYTERYISFQIPNLSPGRNVGNPDLEAERSHSIDLGIDIFLRDRLNLSATLFARRSKNLIDFSLRNADEIDNVSNLQAGQDYFYASNISDSQLFGLELSVDKTYRFNTESKIYLRGAYTFLKTGAETGELSKYISNHPSSKADVEIGLNYKWFGINSLTSYLVRGEELITVINAEILKDYLVSNIKIDIQLGPSMQLFTKISNITNLKYQEILGARMPGRWTTFGLAWDL